MKTGGPFISVLLSLTVGFCSSQSAYAIKPDNVNDLAESIVQSMKDSNTDPGFKRGVIQEIHPLMRVNASLLKGIRQFGLLNQHQTQTSKGALNPSYRYSVESQMQGLGQIGLATANPTELFPKYGYMNYKTDGKEQARQSYAGAASQYGDVIFVFKQDDPKLLSRVTYSLDDSLRTFTVYPLNHLGPLEGYQKGKVSGGQYRELQYWGTLDLNEVQEIWLTSSLSEENKKILKEIAQTYGLPVYQTDENQGSDYEHLRMTRKKDPDLSGTVTPDARPFKQISGAELIEYHKKAIEPDLNSTDSRKKGLAEVEERIVTSLLAERGQVKDLPPKLEKEVQSRIEGSRKNLVTLATGNNVPPRVRSSALHALLDETWSSPWLTQSEYKKLVPHLFDERVFKELESRYYKTGPMLVTALRKQIPDTEKGIDLTPIVASYLIPTFSKTREAELRGTKTVDEFLKIVRKSESQSVKKVARDQAVAKTLDHWLSLRPEAARTEKLIQDLVQGRDTLTLASFITGADSSSAAKFLAAVSPACSANSPTQKKACQEILSETTAYFLKLKPNFDEAFQLLQFVAREEVLQDTAALPVMIYAGKLALSQGSLLQYEKVRELYRGFTSAQLTESHKKAQLEFDRSTLGDYASKISESSKFSSVLWPRCYSSDLVSKKVCFEVLSSNLPHFLSLKPTFDEVQGFLRSIYSEESFQEVIALPLMSYAAKSGIVATRFKEVLDLYDESKPTFTAQHKKVKSEFIQQLVSSLDSQLPKVSSAYEYSSIITDLCSRPESELKKLCLSALPKTIHSFLSLNPRFYHLEKILRSVYSEESLQDTVALPLMSYAAKSGIEPGEFKEVLDFYDESSPTFTERHKKVKSELIQQVAPTLASQLPTASSYVYFSIVRVLCTRPESELKKVCLSALPSTIHSYLAYRPSSYDAKEMLKFIILEDSLQKTVALPVMEYLAKEIYSNLDSMFFSSSLSTYSDLMDLYDKSKSKQFSEGHQEAKDAFAYSFLDQCMEKSPYRSTLVSTCEKAFHDLLQEKKGSPDPKILDLLKKAVISKEGFSEIAIKELAARKDAASFEVLQEVSGVSGSASDSRATLNATSQLASNDSERMSKLLPLLDSKNATVRKAVAEELGRAVAQVARGAPKPGRRDQLKAFQAVLGSQATEATIEKILKEKGLDVKSLIESKDLPQEEDVLVLKDLIEELQEIQARSVVDLLPSTCAIQ